MNTPEPIRVLIVDDSRIFRRMMQSVLEEIPGVEVVGSVFSGESALEFIAKSPPDLVTLDIAHRHGASMTYSLMKIHSNSLRILDRM